MSVFQVLCPGKKELERFFGVLEPLDMRQKSTGFDCENKSWWNLEYASFGTPLHQAGDRSYC